MLFPWKPLRRLMYLVRQLRERERERKSKFVSSVVWFLDGEIMALLINETKKPREHVAPPTSARDNGSSSSSDEGSSSSSSEEESELRQFGSTSYAVR